MAAGDLTTLEAVKAWLDISGTTSDTLLADLITRISAYVPNAIQRQILTADYTETRIGNGKDRMLMAQWPVQSIASVAWRGTRIATSVGLFDGAPGAATDGRSLILIGHRLPYGEPVQIAYRAGYDTVPADVQLAVTELVGEAYTRRSHIGETAHASGTQMTVSFDAKAMHAAIRDKLDNYRAVVPTC